MICRRASSPWASAELTIDRDVPAGQVTGAVEDGECLTFGSRPDPVVDEALALCRDDDEQYETGTREGCDGGKLAVCRSGQSRSSGMIGRWRIRRPVAWNTA